MNRDEEFQKRVAEMARRIEYTFVVDIIQDHGFPKALHSLLVCAKWSNEIRGVILTVLEQQHPEQLDAFNNALLLM